MKVILKILFSFDRGSAFGVTHFQLADCAFGKSLIAAQVMGIEDRAHVTQAVPGERRDLRLRATDQCQPRDRSATQVIEGDALDVRLSRCLPP